MSGQQLHLLDCDVEAGAILSEDRKHRYQLWRIWNEEQPVLVWIMLNPSWADETTEDPTIKRCMKFAGAWGYGSIYVGNLYSQRSENPKDLNIDSHDSIEGRRNQGYVNELIAKADEVVYAWGNGPALRGMGFPEASGADIPDEAKCLGVNRDGTPKHPLYLLYSTPLVTYNFGAWAWERMHG